MRGPLAKGGQLIGRTETHFCEAFTCKIQVLIGEFFCDFHITKIDDQILAELVEHGNVEKDINHQSRAFRKVLWKAKHCINRGKVS